MTYTSDDVIKSMKMFFIDNQGAWPADKDSTCKAELVGDLVVYPDNGKYPNFVPVACATHPNFKGGLVVVQAGTRGLLVSFIENATAEDNLQERFRTMKGITQYRVAIDAIVHRMVMHFVEQAGGQVTSEVEPLSLMAWMAASERGRASARIIGHALASALSDAAEIKLMTDDLRSTEPNADAFTICDGLLTTIQQSIAARAVQTAAAPVQRRK